MGTFRLSKRQALRCWVRPPAVGVLGSQELQAERRHSVGDSAVAGRQRQPIVSGGAVDHVEITSREDAMRAGIGCQGPVGSAQWRTVELPSRGQQNCPFVANRFARGSVGQWRHPLAGGGLGEADAVAGGEDDVGVVQEPVDGGVGDGLGHEFVEPTWRRLLDKAMERFS